MIISIWRYSHLALAISSFIFILIASITGIILALEPISEQLKPYAVDLENQSLAKTVYILQEKYDEVISVEKDHNDFIIASVITKEGNDERFYINPYTGEKIGDIIVRAPVYQFSTNLHRSLFLKSTGRIIIGIVSFFLFLISCTGLLLVVKRQGGISQFFSKVVKEDFQQYYHVVIGRFSLIPIIIITVTGVYLSLEKFSLLPKHQIVHTINQEDSNSLNTIDAKDFAIFKNTPLDNLKSLEFPFSEDPEDYYHLKIKNKEVIVHQYSGKILSEQEHPFVMLASRFSLNLHTGRGSIIWSLILLLATSSILFFIYSGFSMTLKRLRKKSLVPTNIYTQDNSEYVILVGTETGSTYKFASLIFNAIKDLNKKVFITDLNQYTEFKNVQHLIVLTSTYGKGEAPANANLFLEKLTTVQQKNRVQFSTIGFGSLAYPDFCKFAFEVDAALEKHTNFIHTTPLTKIHNQSFSEFSRWFKKWSSIIQIPIQIPAQEEIILPKKQQLFQVIKRAELNVDDTFTLQLRPQKKVAFQSGDLLEFYPKGESVPRLYSVGVLEKDVLLSIKAHEFGICSTFFSRLSSALEFTGY
ncbi:MAG: PepSY domain-containing protein, partial [Flavobacteriaceae bacterium]|nr:PepSY domain-containing protein [Flavobacteriaceae bacterium]